MSSASSSTEFVAPFAAQINDIRSQSAFRVSTFSGYKKTDVTKALAQSLLTASIESACNWCAELVCSNHYAEIWDVFVQFYTRHIHAGNPRIAAYLMHRYQQLKSLQLEYQHFPFQLRNDVRVRRMFAEIVCILADATRKHCLEPVRLNAAIDFDMQHMRARFRAPNDAFAREIFCDFDPKEFIVAVNELAYNLALNESALDSVTACYWIEWIHAFEAKTGKAAAAAAIVEDPYACERRHFAPVDAKFQCDIIWLIWDVFLAEVRRRVDGDIAGSKMLQKIVQSLLEMYCINYTKGCFRRRKYILYFVVQLLCDKSGSGYGEDIVKDRYRNKITAVVADIDAIYRHVKKCEQTGGVEYMFHDLVT